MTTLCSGCERNAYLRISAISDSNISYQNEIVAPEIPNKPTQGSKDISIPWDSFPLILIGLYTSADLYQLPPLKNEAMDALRKRLKDTGHVLGPHTTARICNNTVEKSLLRTFAVDILVWSLVTYDYFGDTEEAAQWQNTLAKYPDFGIAVITKTARLRGGQRLDPRLGKDEEYHEAI